jgi:hypothetical protein
MKNIYKTAAIGVFGLMMIFAQGADAQTRGNNGNRNQGRGDNHHPDYRPDHHLVGIGHRNAVINRTRAIHTFQHHNSNHPIVVNRVAPSPAIGFRVNSLPVGFRAMYTPSGVFYIHNGIYYKKASFGIGFVVTSPPVLYSCSF